MKFILLIMVLTFGAEGGVSVTSAEFDSKEKCILAANAVQKNFDTIFTQQPKTLCVEK